MERTSNIDKDRALKDRRNFLLRARREKKKMTVETAKAKSTEQEAEEKATVLVSNAIQEASKILEEAKQQAHAILGSAEEQANGTVCNAKSNLDDLEKQIGERKICIHKLRLRIRSLERTVSLSAVTQENIILGSDQQLANSQLDNHVQSEATGLNHVTEVLDSRQGFGNSSGNRSSGTVGEQSPPNRSKRRAQAIVTEMLKLFMSRTRTLNGSSKRQVLKLFWSHNELSKLHPSSLGCPKLDLSVAAGLQDIKTSLQVVKMANRRDYKSTKDAILTSFVGPMVREKRSMTSLSKALGIKRHNLYRASKVRSQLDSNKSLRHPMGERRPRSDKLCGETCNMVELYWETRTRVSPNKKDEVRKRLGVKQYETHRVHWLEETEVEFYFRFKEWCKSEGKTVEIGLRSFQKLKPYYVSVLKDRNVCCCKKHVEMDLLKEGLNKLRIQLHPKDCTCDCQICALGSSLTPVCPSVSLCLATKNTIHSVREWCEEIVCPKLEGQIWHKKKCIMGECNRCGVSKLKYCKIEMDPSAGLSLDWQTFQYVTLEVNAKKKQKIIHNDGSSKPIKRLRMVYKTTSVSEFMEKVQTTMPGFVIHNFQARWQSEEYKRCLANFPRGTIVSGIDFAENYTFKVQDEVQSLHWDNRQLTILVLITYRHKADQDGVAETIGVDRDVVADYHFYISDDNAHDTLFVQHCLNLHSVWMKELGIQFKKHWMWSDGCAAQFKACRPFYFVSRYFHAYGARMIWCFHASGHGKGVHDGLGGTIKSTLTRAQLHCTAKLENAHDVVEFLKEKFAVGKQKEYAGIQEVRRVFVEVAVDEVDRKLKWDCAPIEGTRILHCFDGFSEKNPMILRTRELCCFCPACILGDDEECSNEEYVGTWSLRPIHPKMSDFVKNCVEMFGTGQGGEDIENDSLADLVELGDFFAVQAEVDNAFGVDFYIMQCEEGVREVVKDFTDAYGSSFSAGDLVLKGIWYQQYGNKETCFVLSDTSPRSYIAAESVVHIKFTLKPTGTTKGTKSFCLATDTLEAIMSSLNGDTILALDD